MGSGPAYHPGPGPGHDAMDDPVLSRRRLGEETASALPRHARSHVDTRGLLLPRTRPSHVKFAFTNYGVSVGLQAVNAMRERIVKLNAYFETYRSGDAYDREAITHVMACSSHFPRLSHARLQLICNAPAREREQGTIMQQHRQIRRVRAVRQRLYVRAYLLSFAPRARDRLSECARLCLALGHRLVLVLKEPRCAGSVDRIYGGSEYRSLNAKYDPGGEFPDLYDKCVLHR